MPAADSSTVSVADYGTACSLLWYSASSLTMEQPVAYCDTVPVADFGTMTVAECSTVSVVNLVTVPVDDCRTVSVADWYSSGS